MRLYSDYTAEQRFCEVARILAIALLRLRESSHLHDEKIPSETSQESSQNCLEVSDETRLSGLDG